MIGSAIRAAGLVPEVAPVLIAGSQRNPYSRFCKSCQRSFGQEPIFSRNHADFSLWHESGQSLLNRAVGGENRCEVNTRERRQQ
jgi:hypothetical protein